jgi:hypothetical protein
VVQSVSLPGRRRRRVADLRGVSFCFLAADAFLGAVDDEGQQIVGLAPDRRQEMVEPVAQRGSVRRAGFRVGEFFLGLALELRLADEEREFGRQRAESRPRR